MFTSEFSTRENNDTIVLAFLQIAVVGILSWIVVLIKGEMPQVYQEK